MAARVVVGLVLLAAGAFKARDRAWPAGAEAFGLPRPAALTLPWVEVVVGALLVARFGGQWTALAALTLLVAFTVAVVRKLAHGEAPRCACFGSFSRAPLSGRTVARNLVLVALAATGTLVA